MDRQGIITPHLVRHLNLASLLNGEKAVTPRVNPSLIQHCYHSSQFSSLELLTTQHRTLIMSEAAVSYAAIILADADVEITSDKLLTLVQAAGIEDVEPVS